MGVLFWFIFAAILVTGGRHADGLCHLTSGCTCRDMHTHLSRGKDNSIPHRLRSGLGRSGLCISIIKFDYDNADAIYLFTIMIYYMLFIFTIKQINTVM